MPRSVNIIALFFPIMFLALLAGCASAQNIEEQSVMTGTVEFLDLEGGCWVIRTDEGKALSPIDLPRLFQRQGLRVSFTATPEPGIITTCMAGEPVRILTIEPLKDQNAK